jgi:hypothetical protein
MWNPMACSFSSTLGSSILNEWKSQIILGTPSLNARKHEKLYIVGMVACQRPIVEGLNI